MRADGLLVTSFPRAATSDLSQAEFTIVRGAGG
jgi:hypothetical protein